MKIAFINIYQGNVERGLETYVSELSERLKKSNDVQVFTGKSDTIKRWPFLWRLYLDPHGIKIGLFTLKLVPRLLKEKYDIVIPLNGGWQPAIIRIITWLYGGKMVISGQSGPGWDDRFNLFCFPDYFIPLTGTGEKWAKAANPFVKMKLIPNGVDLNKFKPQGEKYGTKLNPPIVICQGAAETSKRLHLAINAVSKLTNVSLLIAGTGSLYKSIESQGQSMLGDRFEMVAVPHTDMPKIYRSGNIFTLPSVSTEAFGISYAEALATNLPVVATDDSTRREIIGEAGFFVNPEDIEAYAAAIKKTLNKKWDNLPRKQAEIFDWDVISKSYMKLFQKIT